MKAATAAEKNRHAQRRYYRGKIEEGACVYPGCWWPARPSRRYCVKHAGKRGRRKR